MTNAISIADNDEEETMSARTKFMLRWAGFALLGLMAAVVGILFIKPGILSGAMGVAIPVSMFSALLLAFYLLILSTKR